MLHLIFQPLEDSKLLDRMSPGDVAVFLESGVLCTLQQGGKSAAFREKQPDIRFYALSEDMAIRGIELSELPAGFEVIDYHGLVQLTVENPLIQSWT